MGYIKWINNETLQLYESTISKRYIILLSKDLVRDFINSQFQIMYILLTLDTLDIQRDENNDKKIDRRL